MIARALGAIAVVALLAAPVVIPRYHVTLLLPAFAYSIGLLGLNLLFGTTGLLSFGHALFVALGAYTAAALTTHFHILHLETLLIGAALVAGVVAVPVGLLCVRYVKIYFGMLTLAFGMLFYSFLYKFYTLTGGDEGIRVLRPRLLGQAFAGLDKVEFLIGPFYYYALAVLAMATLLMHRIVRSPFGLGLRAIRENPDKAAYVGVAVRRYRFYAFVIAAVFGAVGGALLAVPTGLADPLLAYWTHSGNLVFMLLLGGFDHFLGPLVGALVFILLQDTVMSLTTYWRFVFGAILAVIVIFFPRGLLGLLAWRREPTA
ncbi:MAG TPA: branched-chain amino acid ABC transporter permease [Candidatus Acidoferrum sp.]|nr:branched-chain amino acid ABC transporter permease [Candidatus Acidoferrum sp.]